MDLKLEQLRQALDVARNTEDALRCQIKDAVEAICSEYDDSGVLPHVTVETRPETVYGGLPRRVRAFVTVDFTVPRLCRPETFTPRKR